MRSRLLPAVAVLGLAALVAIAVLTGLRAHHRRQDANADKAVPTAEQQALSAARGEAIALTSISYQDADADLDRILAGATGGLKTQFAKERSQLPKTLATDKSTSKGTALSSGLSYLRGNSAQALVAVDATVTGTDTGSSGVLKHYRMVVTLQRIGDHWLASDVAFAGAPQ